MLENLLALKLPPGLYRNGTRYQAKGRWYDANLVRFYEGAVRPVQGWRVAFDADGNAMPALAGVPRAALGWRSATGVPLLAVGTTEKLYVIKDGVTYDITPEDFNPGAADSGSGNGDYGDGLYGKNLYGVGKAVLAAHLTEADTWQLDAFGDVLVACCTNGGRIYVWTGDTAAVAVPATDAPEPNRGVVITPERFIVALGANDDVRLVQWASQATLDDWTASDENTAGDFTLSTNGRIMCGRRTKAQTLIWTDADLQSMNYIGGTLVYSFKQEGDNCGIIAPQAVAIVDTAAIWMGRDNFFQYDGFVKPIPCEVHDYVFGSFNSQQAAKVFACPISEFSEIWWFYPSAGSVENDRYVVYNYRENHWTTGKLARTAAIDRGAMPSPVMFDGNGTVYQHEQSAGDRTIPLTILASDSLEDADATALEDHAFALPPSGAWSLLSGDGLVFNAVNVLVTDGIAGGIYVNDVVIGKDDYEASIVIRKGGAIGVRGAGDSPAAIYFGLDADGTNFRLFGLDAAGAAIFTELTTPVPAGMLGSDLTITLRCSGSTFTGFANGIQMLSKTDATYTTGGVQLKVEAQSVGLTPVVLDSFTDTATTDLNSHVPDVGGTWSNATPAVFKVNASNQLEVQSTGGSDQHAKMSAARTFADGDEIYWDVTPVRNTGEGIGFKFARQDADSEGYVLFARATSTTAVEVRLQRQTSAGGLVGQHVGVSVAWNSGTAKRVGVTLVDVTTGEIDVWLEPAGGGARTTLAAGVVVDTNYFDGSHTKMGIEALDGYVAGTIMDNLTHLTADVSGGNAIFLGPLRVLANIATGGVSTGDVTVSATTGEASLVPFLESGPIELGDGDTVMRVQRIVPDERNLGDVEARFFAALMPTDTETELGPFTLTAPTPVRFSARQVRMRVEEVRAVDWRLGTTRLGIIPGGRR